MSTAAQTTHVVAELDYASFTELVFTQAAARGGDILFAGTLAHMQSCYETLEQQGSTCWTIDPDPIPAGFGRTGRHITGCVLDISEHFAGREFSMIIISDASGLDANRTSDQLTAILACVAQLTEDGVLVFCWNDSTAQCGLLEELLLLQLDYIASSGLPPRFWVLHCDQQFAFLGTGKSGDDRFSINAQMHAQ